VNAHFGFWYLTDSTVYVTQFLSFVISFLQEDTRGLKRKRCVRYGQLRYSQETEPNLMILSLN